MKVALVNPGGRGALRKENLGLAYLAACLRAEGHKVRVLDEIAGQRILDGLAEFRPEVVGISCMTMFAPRAYLLADRVRATWPGVPIVFGGAHPSALPEEALEHGDCVIRGEAEVTFPKLLTSGRIVGVVEGEAPEELDALPLPARDALDLEFYADAREGFAGFSYRNLGVITSRGCPFLCDFCINSKRKSPLRLHSAERVIKELQYLVQRYRVESIAFYDELAAAHPKRFREICERMIEAGLDSLRWECQIHARRIDTELLQVMKRAGCIQIGIGFESGSQRMLDAMGKNTTVEANLEAVRRVHEAGLRVRGCFIIGTPGETREDIDLTRQFIERAKIDFVSINYLTPYPGTTLFDRYADRIAGSGISWERYTTGDPDTFPCNDAMPLDEQKRAFELLRAQYAFKNYSWFGMARRALQNPRYALHIATRLVRP